MNALMNYARFFSGHPLTRDAPAKAWLRLVDWQIKSRLSGELVIPWIEGQKLAVRRGMTGATGNIYVGLHEFVDMTLLLHFLREGDLFLDIGANVGSYTVLASGVRRAEAWAFEPDPDTVKALERNLEINELSQRVRVHVLALGPEAGEIQFTVGLDTMNKVTRAETGGRIVRLEALDNIIGAAMPAMVKMDVEGYEEQVLLGARETLRKDSLQLIELETVSPSIHDMLFAAGFELAYYDPFSRSLAREPFPLTGSNSIYVRDWDLVSRRLIDAQAVEVLGRRI